jgi:hypothetical protein
MSTAPVGGYDNHPSPCSAGKQATRARALEFVRRKMSPDMQYRPIHLTEDSLVELLTEFREEQKW